MQKRINNIIKEVRRESNKFIALTQIKVSYIYKYYPNISLSTVSRIMKNHLNLHFKRIKIKNPKLTKNNYKFMKLIFLKVVLKPIFLEFDIIYIDETACYWGNENFKNWINENA